MSPAWKLYVLSSALVLGVIGSFIWWKKKRTYIKVGKVSKLFFFPVKSLKGYEVTEGMCTKVGFEVNGVIERSFMLVNGEGVLISQREAPGLVLLTTIITGKTLIISSPSGNQLKVEIKDSFSPKKDELISCRIHQDIIEATDCGEQASAWFQSYLEVPSARLVRYFPNATVRKYTKNNPYISQMKKANPIGFQDAAALHMLSQASLDDLNLKLTEKVSVYNFRPSILVDETGPYEEDSWTHIKLTSGAEIFNFMLTTRCILTTNNPETGILTNKEPLVTLRKYRIPGDPSLRKIIGAFPCLGISCHVLKPGEIKVGDDIYAVVGDKPQMLVKW